MSARILAALGRLLDRLAEPAPRLGVDLAILSGAFVALRIVWLGIQLLGEIFG